MITDKDLSSRKVIRKIGLKMKETPLEELCRGMTDLLSLTLIDIFADLPNNFVQYFKLIEKYEFEDRPDYEELKKCFRFDFIDIPQ